MSEGLTKVLASAEGFYPPLFSFDDVESWPAGELELCVESGLLRLGKPAVALNDEKSACVVSPLVRSGKSPSSVA